MSQRSSSKGVRSQLAQLTLNASLLFSMWLGAMPLKYNFKQRRLEQSRFICCYCLGCNLFLLAAIVGMAGSTNEIHHEFFAKKPLNTLLSTVHGSLTVLLVLVTLYRNWSGRKKLLQVFRTISQLDQQNFLPSQKSCELFECYVIWKGVVGVLRTLSTMYILRGVNPPLTWVTYALMLVLWLVVQHTLMLIWNHFYFGLLFIYKQFWVLNEQLKDKIKEFNAFSTRACEMSAEINALMLLYVRLIRLCEELTDLYDYQILLWLAFNVSSNVASSFFFCVILGGKVIEVSFYFWTLLPQLVFINILDLWLCFTTCELTMRTASATSLLLRSFNDFHPVDVRLLQRLNDFALLCACETPRFRICGLFELHHRSGHQLLITTALYLLFLVQFDFMNL